MTTRSEKSEGLLVGPERRRAHRVALSFQVEITGFDSTGQMFCEQTVTTDVSENGFRFDLLRELQRGDVLLVRLSSRQNQPIEEGRPMAFEVAWVVPSPQGWSIGAATLQHKDLWHMQLPTTSPPNTSI